MAERFEGGEHAGRGVEERDVWPVHFVPAEGVDVDVEGLDVDGAVGRVGYAVDAEEGVGDGVHESGDCAVGC